MKYLLIPFMLTVLIMPACRHDVIPTPIDPDPVDTTVIPIDTLTCEDTIDINLPGYMEHGYVKAVKTCRDWLASGEAYTAGPNKKHLVIKGRTYFTCNYTAAFGGVGR